jgi:hypothetical protein
MPQCHRLAAAPALAKGEDRVRGVGIHFGFHKGKTGQLNLGFPELGTKYI